MARKTLTKKQKELAERLVQTGLKRPTALALVYTLGTEETRSKEIEVATGLKQPEVSIAMSELRERGWVTKRDIKREGQGRPVHGYKLDIPLKQIIKEIEDGEKERINEIKKNMKAIKNLTKSM